MSAPKVLISDKLDPLSVEIFKKNVAIVLLQISQNSLMYNKIPLKS